MIFKPKHGSVWHVMHETATGTSKQYTCTLCSQKDGRASYSSGERRCNGTPTCADCLALDSVFGLTASAHAALYEIATDNRESQTSNARGLRELLVRDLLDAKYNLTARGRVLASDFTGLPFVLPDETSVYHARFPLSQYRACLDRVSGASLPAFHAGPMYVQRYGQLRTLNEKNIVNCIACIAGRTL